MKALLTTCLAMLLCTTVQSVAASSLDENLIRNRKLLLISNSASSGEAYLAWPQKHITAFLSGSGVKELLFIPWAGVNLSDRGLNASFEAYAKKVQKAFAPLGLNIRSLHREADPVQAVQKAAAIAVGGGNTFHLLYMLHKTGVIEAVRMKVAQGTPYIGWSAGANVACPTLRTTNDMPIIEPQSFAALNLIPFQINPHYLDAHPQGHGGETRQQRIEEFLAVNREVAVVGLREGTALIVEGGRISLVGSRSMRVFHYGREPRESQSGENVSSILKADRVLTPPER